LFPGNAAVVICVGLWYYVGRSSVDSCCGDRRPRHRKGGIVAGKADVQEAVAWAAENYERVAVLDEKTGRTKLHWGKAESDPPPMGRSYMRHAANNPSNFFSQTVPKFLSEDAAEEVSEEDVKAEKKSIAEMRALLKQFMEVEKK